jgi:hypothetical protein
MELYSTQFHLIEMLVLYVFLDPLRYENLRNKFDEGF